jgi:hypothetical protein
MGQLDGLLDPEGFKLVQEAIRDLSAKCADDDRRIEQRRADALVTLARFYLTNGHPTDATTRPDTQPATQPGRSPGTVLDFGRQTRTISDPLFEVLAARDHGCRIKECPVPSGGCDAHHADHWADNGATEPDNLPLLCWFHHHLVHEQHWSIKPLGGGHFILIDPDGGEHEMRPPMIAGTLPQLAATA